MLVFVDEGDRRDSLRKFGFSLQGIPSWLLTNSKLNNSTVKLPVWLLLLLIELYSHFSLLPEQCKVNKNCSTYLLTYVYMDKKWLIMCCKNKPCFNHRVVTLVTDKLKKQWLCVANYIRQPQGKLSRQSYNQSLTVSNHWTSVKGHSCLYQRACNNNHDLATTEHPWQSC